MSEDLTLLARPEILALKAYESARSLIEAGTARLYLDANESQWSEGGLNRYPDPQPRELVARFMGLYGVRGDQLVIGRGSDEAIDLLVRTFCRAGTDSILLCPPTYGVYEIAAQIQGAGIVRVPLRAAGRTFVLDEPAISAALAQAESTIKIIFLCSPNNPTGTAIDPSALIRVCEAAAGRALVVVDEAYAEFSDERSMLGELARLPNLIVLRTLSKAWALAAARCGVAIGAPPIIALLHKVRAPYPLPSPAVQAALAATGEAGRARLAEQVSALKIGRARMLARLAELPCAVEVIESSANFLLVRFKSAARVMEAARAAGIVLRDRSREPGLEQCVRITLGRDADNHAVLCMLAEVHP